MVTRAPTIAQEASNATRGNRSMDRSENGPQNESSEEGME